MSEASVKDDRHYTKDHEWAKSIEGELVIGITDFAVNQLGDITLVTFDVEPGESVEAGQTFGTIESVKALSDLFAPVSGKVVRLNEALEDSPELVNDDPWEKAWMVAIAPADPKSNETLMTPEDYQKHVDEESAQ